MRYLADTIANTTAPKGLTRRQTSRAALVLLIVGAIFAAIGFGTTFASLMAYMTGIPFCPAEILAAII